MILSRWYGDDEYRKSLSDIGWREHHVLLFDRIALERHIYVATQNSKHWILTIHAERPQQPSINDPTLLKRKENANDCATSTWQEPNKNT